MPHKIEHIGRLYEIRGTFTKWYSDGNGTEETVKNVNSIIPPTVSEIIPEITVIVVVTVVWLILRKIWK